MVPKVAKGGRSFKGAGLYYLHDKKASTTARVAFTHTENLPTSDPEKAIRFMAYTAMRQHDLKLRSGGSAKGRKLTHPVYVYSLSWAPGQDPTQDMMIRAAKESLAVLGLSSHEALLVGHNDEPHPHIHVIVNRVHPETGVAAKLSKDFLKLSAWAEEFERLHGEILCEQRVENNARRRNGEFAKDRESQSKAEFHRWRQERKAQRELKRAAEVAGLRSQQQEQREALWQARTERLYAARKRLRDQTRADWRDLFAIQRQEQARLERAQASAWTRLRHFVKTHGREFQTADRGKRKQLLKDAFFALIGSHRQHIELERKQKDERIFFARKLRERIAHIVSDIRKEHAKELEALRKKQGRERHDQRFRHAFEKRAEHRERREGKDKAEFEREHKGKPKSGLNKLKDKFREGGLRTTPTPRERSRNAEDDQLKDKFKRALDKSDQSGSRNNDPSVPRHKKDRDEREPD